MFEVVERAYMYKVCESKWQKLSINLFGYANTEPGYSIFACYNTCVSYCSETFLALRYREFWSVLGIVRVWLWNFAQSTGFYTAVIVVMVQNHAANEMDALDKSDLVLYQSSLKDNTS